MNNKKVDFLIIGTQKAGTTSLYHYIKQHREIYFSEIKEITYFVDNKLYNKGEVYYHSFFTKYNNEKIVGSAYVHMLPCLFAPERVKNYNPKMKFIVMLREPISRAYSAYKYAIKNGWEDSNIIFETALRIEEERIADEKYDLMYFYNGLYSKHINHWYNYFPKEQFILIRDIDLKNDPKGTLKNVFQFLDLTNNVESIDYSKEYNKAGKVRFKQLQRFLLSKNNSSKKMVGKLLPKKTKVWIRSKVLPKIYALNHLEKNNESLSTNIDDQIKRYFESDLLQLEKNENIKF